MDGLRPGRMVTVVLPLPREDWATLRLPYPMTEDDWALMLELLALMKPGLVIDHPATSNLPEQIEAPA
jgi:hypothetical protein